MEKHKISLRINREIYYYFQDKIREGNSACQLFSPILSTLNDSSVIYEPLGFNHDLTRSILVPYYIYAQMEDIASRSGLKASQIAKIVLIMLFLNGTGKGERRRI